MGVEYTWSYKDHSCRIEELFDGGELKAFHFVTKPRRKTERIAPVSHHDFSRKTLELWIDAGLPESNSLFTRESLEKLTGKKVSPPKPVVHLDIIEREKRLATIKKIQEQEFAPDPEPEPKTRKKSRVRLPETYQCDEYDEPDCEEPDFFLYENSL